MDGPDVDAVQGQMHIENAHAVHLSMVHPANEPRAGTMCGLYVSSPCCLSCTALILPLEAAASFRM